LDRFNYVSGRLHCESVDVNELADRVGTPFYLYSKSTFLDHLERLTTAFRDLNPLVCYSIKNCANINIIRLLVDHGAGVDVVSGGELYRALEAGADASKVVFAGVGKTDGEIHQALEAGVGWINVESEEEFENVRAIATAMGCAARAALRINPDVYDPGTHEKATTGKSRTKFGVDLDRALRFFETYGGDPHLPLSGLHMHLGSPIYSSQTYVRAITKMLSLREQLEGSGHRIEMINIGGGYVAHYDGQEEVQTWDEYGDQIVPLLRPFVDRGGRIILEPGRSISANAGVLISRVQYKKVGGGKTFLILDTGMSHLIRPTLYGAYHFIWPTSVPPELVPTSRRSDPGLGGLETYDVVGPICESGDYLARNRELPPVSRGDLLCIFTAGAYGMVMASQYNSIPRPPEILVDGRSAKLIRRRENYEDLIDPERQVVELSSNAQ
jgi:diaminopimelate decarboxylase